MKTIKLTQSKTALVDDEDYPSVRKVKWFARFDGFNWYAARNIRLPSGRRLTASMHSFIMGSAGIGVVIDHKNRNGLDNRKKNLRFVTHTGNARNKRKQTNNTAGCPGVSFHKATGKYRAYGKLDGKHIHLGLFEDIIGAASAYKKFAIQHYKIHPIHMPKNTKPASPVMQFPKLAPSSPRSVASAAAREKASPNPSRAASPANIKSTFGVPKKQK